MALTYSEPVRLGMPAPPFSLRGTDDVIHHLTDFRYAKALVLVFMCNHCPYVQAVQGRINALAREYRDRAIQFVGINSNDSARYPADGFEQMKRQAVEHGFVFPYLWDETQEVAKAYGAVCTPDFFLFEQMKPEQFREADVETAVNHYQDAFVLRYRGRLDDCWQDEKAVTRQDLRHAMDAVLFGRAPEGNQHPSMGCSIKWK